MEQAILVGNSAGGQVALLTALLHPERVRALVMVDAAVFRVARPRGLDRKPADEAPGLIAATATVGEAPSKVTTGISRGGLQQAPPCRQLGSSPVGVYHGKLRRPRVSPASALA